MPRAFTGPEREIIRSRLLAAARETLPRTGFRRTPVESLCHTAGISKGAFYLFFDSKEAMWAEVLSGTEAEIRAALRAEIASSAPDRLGRVLALLFRSPRERPELRALADAGEREWLARGLPPGSFEAAREDDDRFFSEIWEELQDLGDATRDVDAATFARLPALALVLVQERDLLGLDRADAVGALVLRALTERLRGDAPAGRLPDRGEDR